MEADKGIRKGSAEELRRNAWASNMARIERVKKEVQMELRKSCGAVDSAERSGVRLRNLHLSISKGFRCRGFTSHTHLGKH